VPDNRIELAAYRILLRERRGVGPWIEAEPALRPQDCSRLDIAAVRDILAPELGRRFRECSISERPNFYQLRHGEFEDRTAAGEALSSVLLEYVTPKNYSDNTVLGMPVVTDGGEIFAAIEVRTDLPLVQLFYREQKLAAVPAFRLERSVRDLDQTREVLGAKLEESFGIVPRSTWRLGGKYHPSPGCTPEVVYPFLVEVDLSASRPREVVWTPLRNLIEHAASIRDGHLLTALFRAAHALHALPGGGREAVA